MPKHAACSTCKDPENRSKKGCVCGGHSCKAKKPKGKKPNARHRLPSPNEKPRAVPGLLVDVGVR